MLLSEVVSDCRSFVFSTSLVQVSARVATCRQASLSRNECYQEWLPPRHHIIVQSFRILRKCQNKFDCLIFEMFFIQELKPTLNKQRDSIRAKLFV